MRFITAIRGSLVLSIYLKTLELESSPDNMTPITLMSTDVERIVQGLQFVHETILSFFTFSIAMWLLERQLGVGAIAPIVVAVCKLRHILCAFAHKCFFANDRQH